MFKWLKGKRIKRLEKKLIDLKSMSRVLGNILPYVQNEENKKIGYKNLNKLTTKCFKLEVKLNKLDKGRIWD